jgi:phage shock protein PspC (stress-responsive transcriptional regulator)
MENMKKLQRDTQNRVLGGVCSGLANYFNIDPALVRVLFVIALLAFSAGFWLYIILWIVMPAGKMVESQEFAEMADGEETYRIKESKANRSGLTAGLILIIAGGCFLLGNLVPQFSWRTFWPIMLIALGVILIVPHKDNKL